MEKKALISALCACVRPSFNVNTWETEYLTKAIAEAQANGKTLAEAIAEANEAKTKETAKAQALKEFTEANAEAIAKANANATPLSILTVIIEAKAKADALITKAKTDEAKAKAKAANAEAIAIYEALAEALGGEAAIPETLGRLKAEAEANAFKMYWDCQNTEKSRLSISTGVYAFPLTLGYAETAANALLSHAVFAEAQARIAKSAEFLANVLDGFEAKAEAYINKGGYIEALSEKFTLIIDSLTAKAEAKAEAIAKDGALRFEALAKAEANAEAATIAAAEAKANTAKGKKLLAAEAKAKRILEAAKTSWLVFAHDNEATAEAIANEAKAA